MNVKSNIKFIVWMNLLVIVAFFVSGCSSAVLINSSYNDGIVIDGRQDDWGKSLTFDEENNIGVGFSNNSRFLYVAVVTSQRNNMMKILNAGLTIWLESEQSGEKIGIRFPQKRDEDDMPMMRPEMRERPETAEDMKKMLSKLILTQNEITIVNENNFPLYAFNKNSTEGISAGLDYSTGQLVYELRVPLVGTDDSPFVFDAAPGSTVYVNIESGEFKRPDRKAPMSRSMNDGLADGGMRGGRRSGGKIGRGEGRMNDMMKKIEFDAEIKLSSGS